MTFCPICDILSHGRILFGGGGICRAAPVHAQIISAQGVSAQFLKTVIFCFYLFSYFMILITCDIQSVFYTDRMPSIGY